MKLRVIADPHLSDKSKGDDFTGEEIFLDFLDDTDRQGFVLVIDGDICDKWEASFRVIFKKYKRVWDKLSWMYPPPVFIIGNHDSDRLGRNIGHELNERYGLSANVTLNYGGILFMHGHQFDQYNKRGAIIGWLIAKIGGYLERRGLPNIDRDFLRLRRYIKPESSTVNYPHEAALYSFNRMIKTVVIGHTHFKCAEKYFGDTLVLNPGCWVNGNTGYLEYVDGKWEQKEWHGTTRNPIQIA